MLLRSAFYHIIHHGTTVMSVSTYQPKKDPRYLLQIDRKFLLHYSMMCKYQSCNFFLHRKQSFPFINLSGCNVCKNKLISSPDKSVRGLELYTLSTGGLEDDEDEVDDDEHEANDDEDDVKSKNLLLILSNLGHDLLNL
jgi:hypothetical protein